MKLRRLTVVSALTIGCIAGVSGDFSTAWAQQGEIIIRTAPPAARYEARGSGRAGYEWVTGYWRWDGRRHVWIAGHWERQRPGYWWQSARWERRGDGWIFIQGRWVRGNRRPPPPDYDRHDRHDNRHDNRPPDYDRGPGGPPPHRPGRDPGYGKRHWEREGWVLLGEQEVRGGRDRDEIFVGRRQGRFTRLLLTVEDSDIELHDMVVVFANGRTWLPRLRAVFRENQRSRVMVLPNGPHALRSIQLQYANIPGGGRATVQVWGR